MDSDQLIPDGRTDAPDESDRADGEDLLRRVDEDADAEEIPFITADMLHQQRVDLEAGMSPIPPLTIALMLACTAIYVRQLWVGGLHNRMRVIETGAISRDEVLAGELWRLISGGFLHASAEHLIGNLIMLFILGMACEHAFGRGPFLFLYVSACAAGSLLAMSEAMPTVGASGAIFGLAGALLATIVAHRHRIELRDHRVAIVLTVWAIYTLGLGLLSPIVSNACHVGGLLGGLVLGWLLPSALLTDRRELAARPLTRLQVALAVAALLGTAVFFLPHLAV
jgi:rhomboid protease GluP